MAGMEAKKIALVLTDPPYGIAICRNSKLIGVATDSSRKSTNHTWDDEVPGKAIFEQIFRVSDNQIIFGANYFLEYLYSSPCYIVWDKRGTLPYVPFAPTEWAWTSFDKMPKKYTVINHGFIRDSPEDKTGHPTQKPLLLMEQIILDFTKPGDTIIDPFMGSGTTVVAALNTGRKAIGIERDPTYFAIAKSRIEKAAQMAAGEFVDKRGRAGDLDGLPMFN
jgi:site-specific DNA-methyltransferase (adenine-specific)